jgi:hypothetical protein
LKITVNDEKIRAELLSPGHEGRQGQRCKPNRLSLTETVALVERLRSGTFASVAARAGVTTTNLSTALLRVREKLGVRDDLELALVAYERGYVTIDEEKA